MFVILPRVNGVAGLAAYFKRLRNEAHRAYHSPEGALVVTSCRARTLLNRELRSYFWAFLALLEPRRNMKLSQTRLSVRQPGSARLPPAALRHYARQRAPRRL